MATPKLSPGLLLALHDYENEGKKGLTPHMRVLGVNPKTRSKKPAKAVVFIHCDKNAKLDRLEEHGAEVNQDQGEVRTAYIPMDKLRDVAKDSKVKRLVSSRFLRPAMDVAPAKVKLPAFVKRTKLSGKNIIIGIVDTGIDATHAEFKGRILKIWDQTLTGSGVTEGAYGRELTGADMANCRDTVGHGTHVAGIAAGGDKTFAGVAPAADLLIVKSDLQDAHIADGVRYIFRVASELNRPAVINLSLGGQFDAHDGSDSLSKIIDSQTGKGRIVCCAAGNAGNDNIHARVKVSAASTQSVKFKVPSGATDFALLNGWYGKDQSIEVAVRTPGGFVTPFQKVITSGSPVTTSTAPDGTVTLVTAGPDPINGDHHFEVRMQSNPIGGTVKGGTWQLQLRNAQTTDANVDVWALDGDGGTEIGFTSNVEDARKIGSPGCALSAVTVAAFTTKVRWISSDGRPLTVGLSLGDISDFSSEGPLRNDTRKPDVTAPGAMIASALSSASSPKPGFKLSGPFLVEAGTSMATPFIAGMVALLLERDPTLDPARVKSLLQSNSRVPGKSAGTFHAKWGFGLIDATAL
jgi:subtilisin family serine protease